MIKKSQITLFIILGLILLFILGIGFYFIKYVNQSKVQEALENVQEISLEAQPINVFVENCLELTAKNGLDFIGKQGGYYHVPNDSSIIFFSEYIPYYYFNNTNLSPSRETIENEISFYIQDRLDECFANFKLLIEHGFSINKNDFDISVKIFPDHVYVLAKADVDVQKGDFQTKLTEFRANIKSSLFKVIEDSKLIINSYSQKPGYVCLTCIDRYSAASNLSVNIIPQIDPSIFHYDIYWVIIKDIGDNNFTFRYVMEMNNNHTDTAEILNFPEIENLTATIGYKFTYKVNAYGNGLKFSDDTFLFDISTDSGLIEFFPEEENIGKYIIKIGVNDSKGNFNYQYIHLEITGFGSRPLIGYMGYRTAKSNEPFVFHVNATDLENRKIYFTSNSTLFKIKNGIINFTPKLKDIGDYAINISAINELGLKNTETWHLSVR